MKDDDIKISVIMPAYNAKAYIHESIDSILNQTFADFELIVIDDASIDGTDKIIEQYVAKDKRVRFVRNKQNFGVTKNRNKGIQLAQGKYIAWQDADDISVEDRLKLQYNFLESHSEVGIVGGFLQFIDEDSNNLFVRKYPSLDAELKKTIFLYSPVSQGVSMVRKSILGKIGGYDETLEQAEDLDVSFRIGTVSQFSNIQKILLKCRFHENSISTKKMRENIAYTLKVRSNATKKYGYKMNLKDKVSFFLAWVIKFFPPKFIFWSFNLLRNNRKG